MAETKERRRSVRIPRLDSLHSIKDEAIRLYRRAAKGTIGSADASRQANVLRVAKECLVEAKLEQEVIELRATLLALQEQPRMLIGEVPSGLQKRLNS